MQPKLPPMRFTGAQVLCDQAIQPGSLAISNGQITDEALPRVDMSGYLLLPGIIDLHGDAFERHIAPRPSAGFDLEVGLDATDRDAAAHGITTAWLAQCWSWEGGRRGPDFAEDLLEAHAAYRSKLGTDLRVQLRCETHMIDTADRMVAAVEKYGVEYVIFNNHLNEAVETACTNPQAIAVWAHREGRSFEQHMAIVNGHLARDREVPRHLCRLADAFDTLGVTYGSHDDPDGETRETYSMIGASIAEFPTQFAAAAAAKAMKDPVLMGAPNVLRGKSQSGNISARDLVAHGMCDALVSDYYYPAMARAAWALVDEGILDLAQAWALISTRPAQVLSLTDRGRLEPGQRADIVAVNAETRAIEMTIAGGVLTHCAMGAAQRLSMAAQEIPLAAE